MVGMITTKCWRVSETSGSVSRPKGGDYGEL